MSAPGSGRRLLPILKYMQFKADGFIPLNNTGLLGYWDILSNARGNAPLLIHSVRAEVGALNFDIAAGFLRLLITDPVHGSIKEELDAKLNYIKTATDIAVVEPVDFTAPPGWGLELKPGEVLAALFANFSGDSLGFYRVLYAYL